MRRRALFLINKHSRHGADNATACHDLLVQRGFELIDADCKKGSDWNSVIREHHQNIDLVIIGGGDGTVNCALDALAEMKLPLGIIPLGTANDLARTLQIPASIKTACDIIAKGQTRKIDLGRVNGKYFMNVSSMGLSVSITRALDKKTKKRWGVFAYFVAAFKVLLNSRPFIATIRSDTEEVKVRTLQIAVGNGRYYGGGMLVAQDAAIDDDRLDLYSLEVDKWWQMIPMLIAMRRGEHDSLKRVRNLSSKHFVITSPKPHSINTDGEITSKTPAHYEVVAKALTIYCDLDQTPS